MKKILFAFVMIFIMVTCTIGCGKEETSTTGMKEMPQFETTDLSGNKVTDEIFSKYELTMINIWSVNCGPCVNEIPELQKLYDDVKDEKVNVMGLLPFSASDTESVNQAKAILKNAGASYTNIVSDSELNDKIISGVSAVPTTIFVDSKGRIAGEIIMGAKSKEEYKNIIDDVLKNNK